MDISQLCVLLKPTVVLIRNIRAVHRTQTYKKSSVAEVYQLYKHNTQKFPRTR